MVTVTYLPLPSMASSPCWGLPRCRFPPLRPPTRLVGSSKMQSPNPVALSRVSPGGSVKRRKCLRCGTLYLDEDNSPTACSFHGHKTGERGLFSFAPPHQGIDGEWSDGSGVIVYKWNEKNDRPNTGSINWKKRWSCCAEYNGGAPPCQQGWHVSYDDGFTLY